jgi:glycerol-3-phosphate dehydrogenase (NAD(P)+)
MNKISVIGAGSWGTTLSILLTENSSLSVTLWEYDAEYAQELSQKRINSVYLPGVNIPKSIYITSSLKEALSGNTALVLAVPSQYLLRVLTRIKKRKITPQWIVSVIKGITSQLKRPSEVISETLGYPLRKIAVLSGPSHAEEVSQRIPTAVVVASGNFKLAQYLQKLFLRSYFRVYSNRDVVGVELGGALKNIIALAAGIIDGLGLGDNTKAALMTRGLVELRRIGEALGAKEKTFWGLSGIGDLIVTCTSKYSRNRKVGEELAKGKSLKEILRDMVEVAEGVPTTKAVYKLAHQKKIEVPITEQVYQVLFKDKPPKKALEELMMREVKPEWS